MDTRNTCASSSEILPEGPYCILPEHALTDGEAMRAIGLRPRRRAFAEQAKCATLSCSAGSAACIQCDVLSSLNKLLTD
eukprot:651887-Pelagomonas_calceolata.AAC.4